MNKKVLISCPVNSRSWVLPYYLRNLYNLDYNKKLIDIYWIINNTNDDSEKILREFQQKYENEYNSITIEIYKDKNKFTDERSTYVREKHTYPLLSLLRNKSLDMTIKKDCDFLFSSDCDVLFQKDILNRLISHFKPVVSSLLYNGYLFADVENAYKYPNILRENGYRNYEHIVNYRTKFPEKNPIGTLIPCEFTGATFLISKEVCKVARFSVHSQGEDEGFCFSARQAGHSIWCDISMYSQHIMSEDLLDQFKNFGI